MVFQKKQTAKILPGEAQRQKTATVYKSKIHGEVEALDDSQSSKFIVDDPDLNIQYRQLEQADNLDLTVARRLILQELKNQQPAPPEDKKVSFLHLGPKSVFAPVLTAPEKKPAARPQPKTKTIKKSRSEKKTGTLTPETDQVGLPQAPSRPAAGLKKNYAAQAKVIFVTFLIFIFISLIVLIMGIYLARWQDPLARRLAAILPLPAVYINGHQVKVKTFLENVQVLENFFKRQNQPYGSATVRQQSLDQLIEFEVISQLAAENKLEVSDAEVQAQLAQVVAADDRQAAAVLTEQLYGWSFETYLDKVIRPLLLRNKVEKNFYDSSSAAYVRETIAGLADLIGQAETRFYKIAAEVNQDESFTQEGDLGWLKLGETAPEFELQLLNLAVGEISPVVETRYGYHLIKLEDRLAGDNDEMIFHASHIYLKKPSFDDYVQEQIKKATVVTLIRI